LLLGLFFAFPLIIDKGSASAMEPSELLVHTCHLPIAGAEYEVLIYCRPDGSHVAKTYFSPEDVIINDGRSVADVLNKHQRLLPLAINSRQILRDFRNGN
jgi:hypothetical protein